MSDIFLPLGRNSLAVCIFYARTLTNNSEIDDITATSRYNYIYAISNAEITGITYFIFIFAFFQEQ